MTKNYEQFFSMALSYIEIGKVSANASTELKDTSDFRNAVAYQLFHAVELFYKYMILEKIGKVSLCHDLAVLEKEYTNHYPNDEYKLDHPFDLSGYESNELNPKEDELVQKHFEKFKPKFMDLHLRYPSDHRTGGYSYNLESSFFEKMKSDMLKIRVKLIANKKL